MFSPTGKTAPFQHLHLLLISKREKKLGDRLVVHFDNHRQVGVVTNTKTLRWSDQQVSYQDQHEIRFYGK